MGRDDVERLALRVEGMPFPLWAVEPLTRNSLNVFHCPQLGHLPIHLVLSCPQLSQTNITLSFAILLSIVGHEITHYFLLSNGMSVKYIKKRTFYYSYTRIPLYKYITFVALLQSKVYRINMRNEVITHDGVVKSVIDECVRVSIVQTSACAGCAAKQICNSAEAKEKEVDVLTSDAASFRIGQKVTLEGHISDGRKAALIAYGLPLAFLLPVLFIAIHFTGSEPIGALCALSAVALYYTVIFLCFRKQLQQQFSFRIK